jgi:hypothetical protein
MYAGKVLYLMAHQNRVRGNIVGEMEVKNTQKDGLQDKLHYTCSTPDGRYEYLTRVNEISDELIQLYSPQGPHTGKDFDAGASQPLADTELEKKKRKKIEF